MNTKQLDAVGDIVGLMLAEALTPIKRQLLELSERLAALPDVAAAVKAAVDALPAPQDGKSVTLDELQPTIDLAVKSAVEALPPAEPGKSATVEDLRPMLQEMVKALPAPKDGKSVTLDELQPVIDSAVKAAVEALPPAEPGKSITTEDVRPMLEEMVKALPAPQDGKSVTLEEVQPLVDAAVKALPAPKDGVGLAGAMIDRDGNLQITTTDGMVKDLGPVVGKSLDTFAMEYLPETHEVRIKAACAGREQEVRFDAGGIRLSGERNGYWCEGVKAKALEAFSYDGNLWVARTATTAKPSAESPDWVLAARQGRIGPAGKDLNAPRAPETIKVGK